MARGLVVVFARAPLYGAVKSRLARDIGNLEASRFYRSCLSTLVRRLELDGRFDVILATTPLRALNDDGVWPRGVPRIDQGQGDLGRRMVQVLRSAGTRPAVLVGTDIPEASPDLVAQAFRQLGKNAFVLGPVQDGGYWLIGARHPARLGATVLRGVRWSTSSALTETAERLSGSGSVGLLSRTLTDVDNGDTYRQAASRLRG